MSFPLVGNKNVKNAIENAISSGHIPHAVLIEGDTGLGRHTLARYFATVAVCTADLKPCGKCHACVTASSASHPDISVVAPEDGKKTISVGQIRTLRAEAFVKAHSAEHRVFIIDGAERMNENAQNALLKVLEEPPVGVIFILIAQSRTTLLETIVSRCTVLSLSAPELNLAAEYISSTHRFDYNRALDAAKSTSGNIGAALTLLGKKKRNSAAEAAEQFLNILYEGSAYDMLKLLGPLERDRVLADEFFSQLRLNIISELRRCKGNTLRCRALNTIYEETQKYTKLLGTNVNLSLLFSAVVCRCKEIIER